MPLKAWKNQPQKLFIYNSLLDFSPCCLELPIWPKIKNSYLKLVWDIPSLRQPLFYLLCDSNNQAKDSPSELFLLWCDFEWYLGVSRPLCIEIMFLPYVCLVYHHILSEHKHPQYSTVSTLEYKGKSNQFHILFFISNLNILYESFVKIGKAGQEPWSSHF